MNIKKLVKEIKLKYDTDNPFEIAKANNILILYEELGSIKGYYNKILRQKQIHINNNLNAHETKYTLAHELGHAFMHPNSNTPFLLANTFLSVNKMEIEADTFAMEWLVTKEYLEEYQEISVEQLSLLLGYEKRLVELRLKSI